MSDHIIEYIARPPNANSKSGSEGKRVELGRSPAGACRIACSEKTAAPPEENKSDAAAATHSNSSVEAYSGP